MSMTKNPVTKILIRMNLMGLNVKYLGKKPL